MEVSEMIESVFAGSRYVALSRRRFVAALAAIGALSVAGFGSNQAAAQTADATAEATPAPFDKLNLNTATEEEFKTIPGVGDRMVREFMEYRPYQSIEEFRREIGKYVDDDQVAEYEKRVYVPIDRNEADAETLKQIPGVDDEVATTLIDGRPYQTNDDFLAALRKMVPSNDFANAPNYLDQES
jgi:DNA uptake protein ComE-like DNA-binding protein